VQSPDLGWPLSVSESICITRFLLIFAPALALSYVQQSRNQIEHCLQRHNITRANQQHTLNSSHPSITSDFDPVSFRIYPPMAHSTTALTTMRTTRITDHVEQQQKIHTFRTEAVERSPRGRGNGKGTKVRTESGIRLEGLLPSNRSPRTVQFNNEKIDNNQQQLNSSTDGKINVTTT